MLLWRAYGIDYVYGKVDTFFTVRQSHRRVNTLEASM